jgi:3'(2'), 5'-bisphosphate nucleotidase
MKNLRLLINPVCEIAIEAGKIINKYYKSRTKISYKEDKTPLTVADLKSNQFIIQSLFLIEKNIPVLSEESLVDWSIRKYWKKYWLVDPLDGTKEFINKNDNFTVNIALIENNIPILGVIYAPALFKLYFAFKNGGSYKFFVEKDIDINDYVTNAKRIRTSNKTYNDRLTVLGSRSYFNDKIENWLNQKLKKFKFIKKGSSIKFCEIAEGIADLYPRFGPTSEWDIAAGHIILTEAGGKLETITQNEMLYNLKKNVINQHFIASCKLE